MSRRTYGLLSIAQRHPRMFAAMHATAADRIIRGEPYSWHPLVPWRTDKPARRRDEPRASRWGDV